MGRILSAILLIAIVIEASTLVIRASKTIKYKEVIKKDELFIDYVNKKDIKRNCKPITKEDILNNVYHAKSYMKKGHIICTKDLYIEDINKKNRILFDFGSIEIETDGKVIKETKKSVRIQNVNGKFETIYKDGRQR